MRYRPLNAPSDDKRLGRFIPDDWKHVEKYPYGLVATTPDSVENTLLLPTWHWQHDQGSEGSCVGHGTAMERAITNSAQNRLLRLTRFSTRRYDPIHLWNEAKKIDEWAETNPGDDNGTSVRAAYDVLRDQGARRISTGGIVTLPGASIPSVTDTENSPDLAEGVSTNRWATTVDEIRAALRDGIPVVIGVNWYSNFDRPSFRTGRFGREEYWIGLGPSLGQLRGGHCVCIYGASDKRQAFKVKNSWGRSYPLVWLPYTTMGTLLDQYGEASLSTDR